MTEEKNTTPLHGSNVAREQIPTACKWHISDIYAGENDWQAACEEYKSKLPQLQAMQGQLNTAAAVCAALKLQEELAKLLDKIYAYARLQQDADNTDQKLQALAGEAEGMAAAFSNANAFIDPDMERHGIELSDWKGMLAGQPLTQAQKDWAQRITGGCQPQNMMAHFPMERKMSVK